MYNLKNIKENGCAIAEYVIQCMEKEELLENNVEDYRDFAIHSNYEDLLFVSQSMLDVLNGGE